MRCAPGSAKAVASRSGGRGAARGNRAAPGAAQGPAAGTAAPAGAGRFRDRQVTHRAGLPDALAPGLTVLAAPLDAFRRRLTLLPALHDTLARGLTLLAAPHDTSVRRLTLLARGLTLSGHKMTHFARDRVSRVNTFAGRREAALNRQADIVLRNGGLGRPRGGDVVELRHLHRPFERAVIGEAVHQHG